MKRCPFCAEQIQDDAVKCRFCGSMLNAKLPEYYVCSMCNETVKPKGGKCPVCNTPWKGGEETFTERQVRSLCPNCLDSFERKKEFCSSCGKFTGRKCPKCGTKRKENTEFCSSCGLDFRMITAKDFPGKRGPVQPTEIKSPPPQQIVVKQKGSGCLGCLVALILLIILLPLLVFVFKVAFAVALFEAIKEMLGG